MGRRDTRQRIVDGCLLLFGEKGCRFTVTELEETLGISRRTIYKHFACKEDILIELLDQTTQQIRKRQEEIVGDETLSVPQKLVKVMTVETKQEQIIQVDKLYQLQVYYPKVYEYFLGVYDEGWGFVKELLRRGREQGIFKPYNEELIKTILRDEMLMLCSKDFLEKTGMIYREALQQMIQIILDGILIVKE